MVGAMSSRTAYVVAFALIGAGLSLLVYRYAILGLQWSGPDHVFIAIAIGLAVGGGQLLRKYDYPHLLAPLAAGLVGFGIAFGAAFAIVPTLGHTRLVARALPGFSIELPDGELKTDETSAYASGNLLGTLNGATTIYNVVWAPGASPDADTLKAMAVALVAGLGASTSEQTVVDGIPTIRAETEKGLLETSVELCGVRYVMITTMGASGIEALHRRIVASFNCHPDAAQEQASTMLDFMMAFDMPGWWAASRDGSQVQVTDGKTLVLLQSDINKDLDMTLLLGVMFKPLGIDVDVTPDGDGRASLVMKTKGEEARGIARMVHCAAKTGIVMALAPDDQLARVTAIIDGGHCLRPGEAPQHFTDGPASKL